MHFGSSHMFYDVIAELFVMIRMIKGCYVCGRCGMRMLLSVVAEEGESKTTEIFIEVSAND